ncbi:MAG: hypothetical protein ACYSSM_07115 [Planctomycetota bacterium]|jgi:S-DNA-T family DNA segregation ATPase FtsK/SpoIIIE
MKKLWVFVSIAIVAIALGGCQKEAEMTDGQEVITEEAAEVVEDIEAEEETEVAAEEAPAQPEEVVVEEVVVQEEVAVVEEPAQEQEAPVIEEAVVEQIDLEAVVVTVNGQEIIEEEVSVEVTRMAEMQKKRMPPGMAMP